jgi:hypothetical protein
MELRSWSEMLAIQLALMRKICYEFTKEMKKFLIFSYCSLKNLNLYFLNLKKIMVLHENVVFFCKNLMKSRLKMDGKSMEFNEKKM